MSSTHTAAAKTSKPSTSGGPAVFLQRKCACGGSAGLTGECEDCKEEKLLGKKLQRKLAINEPGDDYECEADRVADAVLGMRDPESKTAVAGAARGPLVQRRTAATSNTGIGAAPPIVHKVLASPGHPLDATTRGFFEPRFGYDFANVRVHSDARAADSARSVNALAYTVGDHIVFGSGQGWGDSGAGHHLLAHELIHVIQQGNTGPSSTLQRAPATSSQDLIDDDEFLSAVDRLETGLSQLRDQVSEFSSDAGLLDSAFRTFEDYLISMSHHGVEGARQFAGLFTYAYEVLANLEPIVDRASAAAEPGRASPRAQLADLRVELERLRRDPRIEAASAQIDEAYAAKGAASRDAHAREQERLTTPEGRIDAAVGFTREFVAHNYWADMDSSAAGPFAAQLGRHYLDDAGLSGLEIRALLLRLEEEDPELLDRALYQGTLLTYFVDRGVQDIEASTLQPPTGAGFATALIVTWYDLVEDEPISLPNFPTPSFANQAAWLNGLLPGIKNGIGLGLAGVWNDIVNLFSVESWTGLYHFLVDEIWREERRYELGQAVARALHAYARDVGNDTLKELAYKLGQLTGMALVELVVALTSAGVAAVVKRLLALFGWGEALIKFAERVADALPGRRARQVEQQGATALERELVSESTEAARRAPMRSAEAPSLEPAAPKPQFGQGLSQDAPTGMPASRTGPGATEPLPSKRISSPTEQPAKSPARQGTVAVEEPPIQGSRPLGAQGSQERPVGSSNRPFEGPALEPKAPPPELPALEPVRGAPVSSTTKPAVRTPAPAQVEGVSGMRHSAQVARELAGNVLSPSAIAQEQFALRYGMRALEAMEAEPSMQSEPAPVIEPSPVEQPATEGVAPSEQEQDKKKKKLDPCADDITSLVPQAASWYALEVGEAALTFSISGPPERKKVTIRDAGVSGRRQKNVPKQSEYSLLASRALTFLKARLEEAGVPRTTDNEFVVCEVSVSHLHGDHFNLIPMLLNDDTIHIRKVVVNSWQLANRRGQRGLFLPRALPPCTTDQPVDVTCMEELDEPTLATTGQETGPNQRAFMVRSSYQPLPTEAIDARSTVYIDQYSGFRVTSAFDPREIDYLNMPVSFHARQTAMSQQQSLSVFEEGHHWMTGGAGDEFLDPPIGAEQLREEYIDYLTELASYVRTSATSIATSSVQHEGPADKRVGCGNLRKMYLLHVLGFDVQPMFEDRFLQVTSSGAGAQFTVGTVGPRTSDDAPPSGATPPPGDRRFTMPGPRGLLQRALEPVRSPLLPDYLESLLVLPSEAPLALVDRQPSLEAARAAVVTSPFCIGDEKRNAFTKQGVARITELESQIANPPPIP